MLNPPAPWVSYGNAIPPLSLSEDDWHSEGDLSAFSKAISLKLWSISLDGKHTREGCLPEAVVFVLSQKQSEVKTLDGKSSPGKEWEGGREVYWALVMCLALYQGVYVIHWKWYTGFIFFFFPLYPALVCKSVRKSRALWVHWNTKQQYQNGVLPYSKLWKGEFCNYDLFKMKIVKLVVSWELLKDASLRSLWNILCLENVSKLGGRNRLTCGTM